MKRYFKNAMIWYPLFLALIIAVAAYIEATLASVLGLAVMAFFISLLMPIIWKIVLFVIKIYFKIIWFFLKLPFVILSDSGTTSVKVSNSSTATNTKEKPQKTKSSGVAKAAFAMGALALARSSKPSKIPHATSSNEKNRNISCQPISGNKWLVTYETLHSSSGWLPEKYVIKQSTRNFNTWGGSINITWR